MKPSVVSAQAALLSSENRIFVVYMESIDNPYGDGESRQFSLTGRHESKARNSKQSTWTPTQNRSKFEWMSR